jgi:hypothetical protein
LENAKKTAEKSLRIFRRSELFGSVFGSGKGNYLHRTVRTEKPSRLALEGRALPRNG